MGDGMSWKASAWAKDQRLGSPSAKSILMCLADYADPEGLIKGWASQADLSASAEVSERTAREWLQRLEEWGLLERRHQQKPNGARAADWIVLRLDRNVIDGAERCRALKDGDSLPADSAGRTNRQPDTEPTGNGAHPTGSQFRAHKEEPPLEPPLPSQDERAGARERGDDQEDRKKIEAAYWRMIKVWPRLSGMPKDTGLKAFAALSAEDREIAERRFPAWLALLKAQGKDHVHQPSTYFGKRLFDDVADPVDGDAGPVEGKPWGPHWAGMCHRELLTVAPQPAPPPSSAFLREMLQRDDDVGRAERLRRQAEHGWPRVKRWHEAVANRKSITVAAEDAWLASLTEFVPVGSSVLAAWRAEYERRGWPWIPDFGSHPGVFFPVGGPDGLEAFENAVRGNGDDGDRQEAAE